MVNRSFTKRSQHCFTELKRNVSFKYSELNPYYGILFYLALQQTIFLNKEDFKPNEKQSSSRKWYYTYSPVPALLPMVQGRIRAHDIIWKVGVLYDVCIANTSHDEPMFISLQRYKKPVPSTMGLLSAIIL